MFIFYVFALGLGFMRYVKVLCFMFYVQVLCFMFIFTFYALCLCFMFRFYALYLMFTFYVLFLGFMHYVLYSQLYPSEESGMLNGLVRQLQRFLLYKHRQEKKEYNTISNIENHPRSRGPLLHTAVMHSLLLGLEKFYAINTNKAYINGDDQELSDSYEDSNILK